MEDKRKKLHEIEKQMHYITQENLELEEEYRKGMEANTVLIKNREILVELMEKFQVQKYELS